MFPTISFKCDQSAVATVTAIYGVIAVTNTFCNKLQKIPLNYIYFLHFTETLKTCRARSEPPHDAEDSGKSNCS